MSSEVQFNLRIPFELKQNVSDAAKISGRSINAEAQYRLEESFESPKTKDLQANVKIINLKNGQKRVIYGKLMNSLDIDYTQSLSDLQLSIELSLNALQRSSFWQMLAFLNKDVVVYAGSNHIDIVDNGRKSLGWLIVEDHYVQNDE